MDEKDREYNQFFRDKFDDFSPDPPTGLWGKISEGLRGQQEENPEFLPWFFAWIKLKYMLYPALILLVTGLIAFFIWQSQPSAAIHGTAYINGDSLVRGTAYLFNVLDKQRPFDSVSLHSTMPLDANGSYHFRAIPHGKYLVRVQIDPYSPWFPEYQFGYYGDKTCLDQSTLIDTRDSAQAYNIHIHRHSE